MRAMHIITGATERSHINSLYEDLGWISLETRRKKHRLKWTQSRNTQEKAQIKVDTCVNLDRYSPGVVTSLIWMFQIVENGRRWASDHRVTGSNPLRGMFRH